MTPEGAAMAQLKEKRYADKYRGLGQPDLPGDRDQAGTKMDGSKWLLERKWPELFSRKLLDVNAQGHL